MSAIGTLEMFSDIEATLSSAVPYNRIYHGTRKERRAGTFRHVRAPDAGQMRLVRHHLQDKRLEGVFALLSRLHFHFAGKFKLQAEVDAHRVFSDSGCDMYGSQADPNLDRGWLDGYKAGRFDGFVDKWKWDNLVLQDGDACKVDESQSYSIKLTMKQADSSNPEPPDPDLAI